MKEFKKTCGDQVEATVNRGLAVALGKGYVFKSKSGSYAAVRECYIPEFYSTLEKAARSLGADYDWEEILKSIQKNFLTKVGDCLVVNAWVGDNYSSVQLVVHGHQAERVLIIGSGFPEVTSVSGISEALTWLKENV